MGAIETSAIMVAIAGYAVVVGFVLLARSGYIVSPKQVDPIEPRLISEPELVREINQS